MVEENGPSERDKQIVERGSGMLTESQRRYLIGKSDIKEGSQRERTIRSRTRERVINGIHDLSLALFRLDERDVQQIEDSFVELDEMGVLYSATARLLTFHLPLGIDSDTDPASVDTEDNLEFNPDIVVDIVADELSTYFRESIEQRYYQMNQDKWGVADAELTGKVGLNRIKQPDGVTEDTAEFRRMLTRYEEGEVSKEELIEKFPFETDD